MKAANQATQTHEHPIPAPPAKRLGELSLGTV